MMERLKLLLRIKDLREEQALRRVNAKRREVLEAEAALREARRAVRESAATLPDREDAVFKPIIQRVVGFDDVEQAKANLRVLQREHTKFVDNAERTAHVEKRLQKQLAEAVVAHQHAIGERDKYATLTDEAVSQWRSELDYREEVEIEDLLIGQHRKRHD
jgi:Type III secretion protein YscO